MPTQARSAFNHLEAICAFALGCALLLPPSDTRAASFIPLGDLTGGEFYSVANAVSADGSVIVGASASSTQGGAREAFRWTAEGGMVGLGSLFWVPGGPNFTLPGSAANGVSADGSVVVGTTFNRQADRTSFMWTVDAGMRDLAPNIVIQGAFAAGVSGDGTVVAGRNFFATSSSNQATRWTSTTGTVGLGGLTDALRSQATAVSLDGETIIGGSTAASGFNEAFRWTETSGMIGLGLLPGGSESLATGVSRKGAVIVGGADSLFGKEAFYWTEKDGMAGLGDLAGGTFSSFANGVSANGKRVVGYSDSGRGQEAFLWTKQDGMISLASFLGGMGANLDGWQLTSATAISADGSTIVGYGINPQGRTEAWVVKTLPEPSAFALMLATLLGVALAGRVRKVRVACGP